MNILKLTNDGFGLIDSVETVSKFERYVNNNECLLLYSGLLTVLPSQH